VYRALGDQLVDNALRGFNSTLFAYSQGAVGTSGNKPTPGKWVIGDHHSRILQESHKNESLFETAVEP